MIILNETDIMGKAYMLSKNSDLIPVRYHPYGYVNDIEENSSCAYFLYKYSNRNIDEINRLLLMYIAYCFASSSIEELWTDDIKVENSSEFNKIFTDVLNEFDSFNTIAGWSFETRANVISDLFNVLIQSVTKYEIKTTSDLIDSYNENDNVEAYLQLNEDYVRVRVGGRYDNDGEDCIYFRISSVGYDWGDDIMNLIMSTFINKVSYITIERDMESAKLNKQNYIIYKTREGEPINNMPIKDFIYQEHIPLVASTDTHNGKIEYELLPLLESGYSIIDSRRLLPKSVLMAEYHRIIKEQINYLQS